MQLTGRNRETFENILEFDLISVCVKYVPSMIRIYMKKTDLYSTQC